MGDRDLSGTAADVAARYGVTVRTARAWRQVAGVASPSGRRPTTLRVNIGAPLLARVEARAEAEGVTLAEVVERALRASVGAEGGS